MIEEITEEMKEKIKEEEEKDIWLEIVFMQIKLQEWLIIKYLFIGEMIENLHNLKERMTSEMTDLKQKQETVPKGKFVDLDDM